ncbi:MGH1-like glycoside hydrolase domain-containing protein [Sphingobacterium pedocola]|uniref:Mannosylglycerate hydrolase MGH1-like glycoside hydrolase domain-containing protein n=1 Tax=Sphingobacterium pedocola TaxID=2082722 RepID=A0ABR9T549_9SPHI|nr:hypothetical protein [Sphingobacterium pedocola]MBE8720465.1 hypothetical protein [Sphingobacterium pedocola]
MIINLEKKSKYSLLTILLVTAVMNLVAQPSPSIYGNWEPGFTSSLQHTHDMALPAWGPYSNKFNGISHIPVRNNGLRFDILVQPSVYFRNITPLASTQRESGYHPWQASADLSYFSYRFQLEWKDRLYCDVSYSKVDEESRLIRASYVNNTTETRSMALNIFSSIMYPYSNSVTIAKPDGSHFENASNYSSFTDSIISFNYNLVYDGQLRGQIKDESAVSKTAIVMGKNRGEQLSFRFVNNRQLEEGVILIRYRSVDKSDAKISVKINNQTSENIELKYTKDYILAKISVKNLPAEELGLTLKTLNTARVALDGFILLKENEADGIKFQDKPLNRIPKEINSGMDNTAVFKYDDIEEYYGMVWSDSLADRRILYDDNPDRALTYFEHLVKKEEPSSHKSRIGGGNNNGYFENVFMAPITVAPGQQVNRYAYVVYGNSEKQVIDKIKKLGSEWSEAENIYRRQQSAVDQWQVNKAGTPYLFSQQLMAATTLTNVNYPTFAGNKFMKHTTPGKRWSAFYTWDAGFIGLGYTRLNLGRALESLNAYTMDSTAQSAFLEHGTPLPVQAYLFNELWNNTQNIEYLTYFYPRLKRYYDFLNGAESSPTRKLKSNLVQTWDIFYNSGGWDDYSPQAYMHKHKLAKTMAPAVNTSHQIRFAKLLKMAAVQLGYQHDIKKYDADIKVYGDALQRWAWDERSGYFGYVQHDQNGSPTGILKHASNVNFNMGLDGVSPLIAGICTPEQTKRILENIFIKGRLWTDQGITAIDQSAPYYNKDGYWNGRVWMPHQWFIWKAMLDVNEPERAIQIAQTALDVWKRETANSYNCWENFSVETGNGGGWHQFGALSSPVLNWFSALYRPGTITHGFNVWPVMQKFRPENDGFNGAFKLFADQGERTTSMLICLDDKYDYEATCNGKHVALDQIFDGLYVLKIALEKKDKETFEIEISTVQNNNLK